MRYFDHHYAGELPTHPRFEPHIEEKGDVCTSILVDRYLDGRHRVVFPHHDERGDTDARQDRPNVDQPVHPRLRVSGSWRTHGASEAAPPFEESHVGGKCRPEEALRQCDVFVLPSLWEGLPLSLILAMGDPLSICTDAKRACREMARITKTGGVVNVIFYPEHIEPGYSEKKKKVDAEIAQLVQRASDAEKGDVAHKKLARDRVRREEYLKQLPPVSVARIVDHIDHIVKLVGIDHVGIGSDFDGIQAVPADLKSVADLPNLTAELLKRGYSESDIDKILGGNMLRVMEEVEKK